MGLRKRGTENGVKREMKQRFEGKQNHFTHFAMQKQTPKNLGKGGGAVINPPLSCQAAKHQISVELHCG